MPQSSRNRACALELWQQRSCYRAHAPSSNIAQAAEVITELMHRNSCDRALATELVQQSSTTELMRQSLCNRAHALEVIHRACTSSCDSARATELKQQRSCTRARALELVRHSLCKRACATELVHWKSSIELAQALATELNHRAMPRSAGHKAHVELMPRAFRTKLMPQSL